MAPVTPEPRAVRPTAWAFVLVVPAVMACVVVAAVLIRGWASSRRLELSAKIVPVNPPGKPLNYAASAVPNPAVEAARME